MVATGVLVVLLLAASLAGPSPLPAQAASSLPAPASTSALSSGSGSGSASGPPPVGTVTQVDHRGIAAPTRVVAAANGDLWFLNGGSIGRITLAGAVTIYHDPAISAPEDLAAGSDGNIWFTNSQVGPHRQTVGRLTPAGVVTLYGLAGDGYAIVAGADGALWIYVRLLDNLEQVMRITTAGAVSYTGMTGPMDGWGYLGAAHLAAGADGSIWYDGPWGCSCIGRYAGGTLHELTPVGSGDRNMVRTVVAPDGDLWFTTRSNTIGRMHPSGEYTTFGDPAIHDPNEITVGPDGALWFTNGDASIGRITTGGVVSTFADPKIDHPRGIATGADGAVWFSNRDLSIGRITTAGAVATFTHPGIIGPDEIEQGADGALWFINGTRAIGRTTIDGAVTSYSDPKLLGPHGLRRGYDQNLYFDVNGALGQISPAGVFTYYDAPPYPPASQTLLDFTPYLYENIGGKAMGPDGNLWLTSSAHIDFRPYKPVVYDIAMVSRVDPAGVRTNFDLPALDTPGAIVAGPDGNLWFVDGDRVGRVTTAGVITLFPVAGRNATSGIAVGPDGALWFGEAGAIGRLTVDGTHTSYPDPSISRTSGITAGPDGALWFADAGNTTIGRIQAIDEPIAPGAPGWVQATAGKTQATVVWSAAMFDGGSPITGYTVTSSPGGKTCTWSSGPLSCVVSGLEPGLAYTFSVRATNAVGTSPPSSPSMAVVPTTGAAYHPGMPTRILDSRGPTGGWGAPLVAGTPRQLQVTGAAGVPATASAVVMNVTATGSSAGSVLSVWPAGQGQPVASNLNFAAGQTIPNLVTVMLGTGGQVSFATAIGSVDVIADVVGYYDDGNGGGSLFNGIAPTRLLDSRVTSDRWHGPLAAGTPRVLAVRTPENPAGVPATATAVIANITATGGTTGSFLKAWPGGVTEPGVSSLNFGAGQTIANLVIVPIGADGTITFANALGQVDVIVDVVGYFDTTGGSRFHAVSPTRVLDDRVAKGLSGPWGPGQSRLLPVGGAAGTNVPAGATGLVANLTATAGTTGSFITVFPDGVSRPNSSNLNFGPGETIPNLVTVSLPANGSVAVYNALGNVDLVADVVGFYAVT